MNRKILILTVLMGVVLFGASFGVSWFMTQKEQAGANENDETQTKAKADKQKKLAMPENGSPEEPAGFGRELSEKELERLILEARETIKSYKEKCSRLEKQEARLNTTKELIERDIQELDKLRFELSQTSVALKEQINRLEKMKVEINESKQDNLAALAATYDHMEAGSASNILSNMAKLPGKNKEQGINDAIKILYYMSDRTRAKLLEQLSENEPELAATFCNKLKFVTETN